MYSYGPLHMPKQKQNDQLEHTYSSYVRIRDVALKSCQRRWTIGRSGERGSGISVLAARHDDDDVKARIDKAQQNSRCVDRDETINHIISECSKFVQKNYKIRHDWVGGVHPLGIMHKHWNSTIRTTLNPSWRMRRTKFSWLLRYLRIIWSRPDDQT